MTRGKPGCMDHGIFPARSCRECTNKQKRENRYRKGGSPQKIGCTPHGYYPAKECSWCSRARWESYRRRKGAKPLIYGCAPHGVYPAHSCRDCANKINRRYKRSRAKLKQQLRLEADRVAESENLLARKDDSRPTAPWNLLKPSPQAQPYFNELLAQMDHSGRRAKCEGNPDAYLYDETHRPSRVAAALACAGCPFLAQCKAYGENELPMKRLGLIWGGVAYDDQFGKEAK